MVFLFLRYMYLGIDFLHLDSEYYVQTERMSKLISVFAVEDKGRYGP